MWRAIPNAGTRYRYGLLVGYLQTGIIFVQRGDGKTRRYRTAQSGAMGKRRFRWVLVVWLTNRRAGDHVEKMLMMEKMSMVMMEMLLLLLMMIMEIMMMMNVVQDPAACLRVACRARTARRRLPRRVRS